ncbi:MAG TPA: hypothetical protein V6C57_07745 [Coleofasciculaceae cyanobacterium]
MRESQAEMREINAKLQSLRLEDPLQHSGTQPPRTQHSRSPREGAQSPASQAAQVPAYAAHRPVTALGDPWVNPAAQPHPFRGERPPSAGFPSRATAARGGSHAPVPALHPPVSRSSHPAVPSVRPAEIDLPPIYEDNRRQRFPEQWDEEIDRVDWEPVQSVQISPEPLADRVNRLQQKSIQQLQQLAQSPPAQMDVALQRLEEQAQQINQLSATQEAAILALKAIAEQIEQDWKAVELDHAARAGYDASTLKIPSLWEYRSASLPQVEKNQEGVLVLTSRSIDLFKAEREAALTAQALRHLKPPHLRPPNWTRRFSQWVLGSKQPKTSLTAAQIRRRRSQGFNRREGVTLLVGAVLVRVLLNLLLSAHPGLWFPAIALMVTPGAIALYRSTVTPRSTLSWGYRLIAIMLGFWIGGRLL